MKILLLTHYYPPEIGAPQSRLSDMAKVWKRLGHDVVVLTCFPNHPTGIIPDVYKRGRFMEENLDGISVKRCWVYATPNEGFVKKLFGHLSFMMSSVIQGRRFARDVDVIVGSSPTFFSIISVYVLSRFYKKPFCFEVRDLWPAIFKDLGVLKNGLTLRLLEYLEMGLYSAADLVVPVSDAFADDIVGRGIAKDKVMVIKNGVDMRFYTPRAKPEYLLDALSLRGKFVVLYIGAHGISHALTKIVDVAAKLQWNSSIHFLCVGEGAEKQLVVKKAASLGLTNMTFLPGQEKAKVPDFYAVSDVCLVPLRDISLFDAFIPSKMFEIMAMSKPIVASVRGEAEAILKRSGAALISEPEDVKKIAKNLLILSKDFDLCNQMGKRGYDFVGTEFNRDDLAKKYVERLAMLGH